MLPEQLIDKQGPLGRAWLASHWERKLSKTQFLQTNLEKTIDAIETNQEQEPIALHISGQLLLGVVRIYSRKTRYLLEDCNEALVKIKLAFKKGDVNIPDIQYTPTNTNAITLQDKLTEFDILLPDVPFNKRPLDRDNIIDPLGDFQHSQDITLSDIQQSFSFGDWEAMGTEQGLRLEQGGVELGRRENEPGYDETSFTLDNLDPLKDMNINDDDGGGGIDFDFDLGDGNDDMRFDNNDNNDNNEFEMGDTSINESQIDTLMQIGIMPVENVFDIQEPQSTPRRKRLVVDKVTEIPHDDLRKYMENPSLLTDKSSDLMNLGAESIEINLRKPVSGPSALDAMFERLGRKRRSEFVDPAVDKEPRFDFSTTPGGNNDDNFEGGIDFDFDDGGFNDQRLEDENPRLQVEDDSVHGSENTQSSQAFNEKTREALDHINSELMHSENVSFNRVLSKYYQKESKARLFYDVLLLSTKGKIKANQERAFGEIQITAA